MNYLANLLSILSLFFGFVSIIFSLESHFTFASWAIIISVIFDGLDGQVARRNPVPSDFGKELDSLIDVVSFGIAPSVLGYIFVYAHFHIWASVALFIYLLSSVMRLAKYNITAKDSLKDCFLGLPTTVSGGILASFILIYRRYTVKLPPPVTFLFIVLLLSFLMVSKVRYINLDGLKKLFLHNKFLIFWVFMVAILAVWGFYFKTGVLLPEISIFVFFLIYLLFSPFVVKSLKY